MCLCVRIISYQVENFLVVCAVCVCSLALCVSVQVAEEARAARLKIQAEAGGVPLETLLASKPNTRPKKKKVETSLPKPRKGGGGERRGRGGMRSGEWTSLDDISGEQLEDPVQDNHEVDSLVTARQSDVDGIGDSVLSGEVSDLMGSEYVAVQDVDHDGSNEGTSLCNVECDDPGGVEMEKVETVPYRDDERAAGCEGVDSSHKEQRNDGEGFASCADSIELLMCILMLSFIPYNHNGRVVGSLGSIEVLTCSAYNDDYYLYDYMALFDGATENEDTDDDDQFLLSGGTSKKNCCCDCCSCCTSYCTVM